MNAKQVRDFAELLNHMHGLLRPTVEQLAVEYPAARIMNAHSSEAPGIDTGDPIMVEPTDEFGDDGIYLLQVGQLLVLRKLRTLAILPARISIEATALDPEVMTFEEWRAAEHIMVLGRVVASCTVRKH